MDMRDGPSGHLSHIGEAHFSGKDLIHRRMRRLLRPVGKAVARCALAFAGFAVSELLSAALSPEFEAISSAVRSFLDLG